MATTAAGERQIKATSVMDRGEGSVSTLTMSSRSFGSSKGLSTTGLLVTFSAPGVDWSPLATNGTGAAFTDDKLVLPRYLSGSTWYQSSASTMLYSDLGPSGYFREMTQVAWVYWPGFSTSHYGRIISLYKFASPAYSTSGAKAGQSIVWGGYSGQKWRSHRAWEYLNGGSPATGSRYLDFGATANPPNDHYLKLAQVLKQIDGDTYQITMYCDTGIGVTQLGNSLTVAASEVSAFGQCGSNCLANASGGPRYDGLGIMDNSWAVPASAGSIYFDEIRLYAGALTPAELEAL